LSAGARRGQGRSDSGVLHLDRASAPATSLATEEPEKSEHQLAQRQPWSDLVYDLVDDLGAAESGSTSIKGRLRPASRRMSSLRCGPVAAREPGVDRYQPPFRTRPSRSASWRIASEVVFSSGLDIASSAIQPRWTTRDSVQSGPIARRGGETIRAAPDESR